MEQLNKVEFEKLFDHALNVESKQLGKIVEKLCEVSKHDSKLENELKDIFLSSNFIVKELELIPEIIDIICEYCKSINLAVCWSEQHKSKFIEIVYTNPDINAMGVIDKHSANISYAIIGKRQAGIWANSVVTEKPILLKDDCGTNSTFFRFILRLFVNLPREYYQVCIGIVQKDYKMKLEGANNSALFGFEGSGESLCFHWNTDANFYYSGDNKGLARLKWNLKNVESQNDDNGNKNNIYINNNNNDDNKNNSDDEVQLDGYFMIEVDFDKKNMTVVCNGLDNNSIKCDIPQKLLDIIKKDECFHIGMSYVAPTSDNVFVGVGLVQ